MAGSSVGDWPTVPASWLPVALSEPADFGSDAGSVVVGAGSFSASTFSASTLTCESVLSEWVSAVVESDEPSLLAGVDGPEPGESLDLESAASESEESEAGGLGVRAVRALAV